MFALHSSESPGDALPMHYIFEEKTIVFHRMLTLFQHDAKISIGSFFSTIFPNDDNQDQDTCK